MSANVLQHPTAWPTEIDENIASVVDGTAFANEIERDASEFRLLASIKDYLNTHTITELEEFVDTYVC